MSHIKPIWEYLKEQYRQYYKASGDRKGIYSDKSVYTNKYKRFGYEVNSFTAHTIFIIDTYCVV